jgi:hypothetical protein
MGDVALTARPAAPRAREPILPLPGGNDIADGAEARVTPAGAAVDHRRHDHRRRPGTTAGTRATCCSGRPGDGGDGR